MKEIGHKIKKVVKGPIFGQMEIFLSENTKIMKNLEQEFTNISIKINLKIENVKSQKIMKLNGQIFFDIL